MPLAALKALTKRCIRGLGWELRRIEHANTEEEVLRHVLAATGAAAVLDVGANIGQFAQLIRTVGYRGIIISFEALPQAHARLCEQARGDRLWKVAPCAALGAAHGEIEMNVAANVVSSSVLPMLDAHRSAAPGSTYLGRQSVPMERLDALALPLLPSSGPLFLKIDTQGYEREVLRGADTLLPRVAGMQIELSLIPLYAGAPTLVEMIVLLAERGYELFGMVPGFKDTASGRLLQIDGFFLRSGAGDARVAQGAA